MRMRPSSIILICICALLLTNTWVTGQSSLTVEFGSDGSYVILWNNQKYLSSGTIAFHLNGQWYSNDGSIGSDLILTNSTSVCGVDSIDAYTDYIQEWQAGSGGTPIETHIRAYNTINALVFEQLFPSGASNTSTGDRNSVLSTFPSFQRDAGFGFVSYNGDFLKYTQAGIWQNETGEETQIASGLSAGPTLLFQEPPSQEALTITVLSAFSEFMAASQLMDNNQLQFGLIGTMESIPEMYSMKHIMYVGQNGVYQTIQEWGAILRSEYNKPDRVFDQDFSVYWLGYNTDNGAYYYYETEPNKNYEETLLDVYQDAQTRGIPYKTILLDSWWYYKGEINGVKNWTCMPQIFPNGLQNFFEQTSWNIIAHNRYWSGNTDYATQNGGQFNFIIDENSHAAMPQEEAFWDYLFSTSYEWGLRVYEQDWLYNEFEGVSAATTDVTVAKRWLTQMANAASRHNIFIQYCMPWPRHILSSVQFPAVSQIRASDDYQPGNAQWKIGYSGMLYQALGIAPFKDNFWTTQYQPGNPYNMNEPHTSLESLVATLSTGPVTIGDALGMSNQALIMKSCRADGLLLKPDLPIHYTDAQVMNEAFGTNVGPFGINFLTHTRFGSSEAQQQSQWSIVIAVNLTQPHAFNLPELELPLSPTVDSTPYLVWSWTNATSFTDPIPTILQYFSLNQPLTLAPCGIADFTAYYFSPVFYNGWSLLGEWTKWTAVSHQRIQSIEWDNSSITIILLGAVNEQVSLAFAYGDSGFPVEVATCAIGSFGTIILTAQVDGTSFKYACTESSTTEAAVATE